MKSPSSKDSIEALKRLKVEMQGHVDDGSIAKLDQIIHDFEQAESGQSAKLTSADKLRLVGGAIELIPIVVKIIEFLQAPK